MFCYALKTIQPLKVEIAKFIFETEEMNIALPMNIEKLAQQKSDNKEITIKSNNRKSKNNKKENDKNNNNVAVPPKKTNDDSKNNNKNTLNSDLTLIKKSKSKRIREKNSNNNDILIANSKSSKILLKGKEKSTLTLFSKPNKIEIKEKNDKDNKNKEEEDEILDQLLLDNYELNNLEYEQACEYDNRSFCRTYISVLMREELVLFTFFSCHDYNLFIVKFARFLVLTCTDMAMNALFFIHKTMYKKQEIEENWTFVQKLPQMLFVLIANHIIEVYLCYLSMTDSSIYSIKELSKKPNNGKQIIDIIDCMKIKLIIFFISCFILLLLFWYFISAFCAVYKNTQYIFVRDSALSFVTSLSDPFIIFGFTMILRKISLSLCCKKKASCLYKLSDIIPIF